MNPTKKQIKLERLEICEIVKKVAEKKGMLAFISKKHFEVSVQLSPVLHVTLDVLHYGDGAQEDGSAVPTYRFRPTDDYSWHRLGTAKRGTQNLIDYRRDNEIVGLGTCEISFLYEEAEKVSEWLLDNLPVIKSLPTWKYTHGCNLEIGYGPGYSWTEDAWEVMDIRAEMNAKIRNKLKELRSIKKETHHEHGRQTEDR